MWRVHKAAGRPWPQLDSDEVVDYLVTEAVATKAAKEDEQALKKREIEAWKGDKTELEKYR